MGEVEPHLGGVLAAADLNVLRKRNQSTLQNLIVTIDSFIRTRLEIFGRCFCASEFERKAFVTSVATFLLGAWNRYSWGTWGPLQVIV